MSVPQPSHDTTSDEALALAWTAGDPAALAVLFERYRDRVTGYAWRMLRRREEAEEVCLEVFCRVAGGAWAPSGSLKAFLFTVAQRLCLDRLRRRGFADRAHLAIAAMTGTADTPEAAAVADDRLARLEIGLAALPEAHRAAVLLFYGQELASKEVADILGCTDQQVRSRLSYARRALRATMLPPEELS